MVDCVTLSAKWYAEWMPKLKGELEAQNLTLARHQSTLDDLLHIKVVNGIPQIDKGRSKDTQSGVQGARRHGDYAVALCMANRAAALDGFVLDEAACQALPARIRAMEYADEVGDDDDNADERGCW